MANEIAHLRSAAMPRRARRRVARAPCTARGDDAASHLVLRALARSDARRLLTLYSDPEVSVPCRIAAPTGVKRAHSLVASWLDDQRAMRSRRWVVALPAGPVVGMCGLVSLRWDGDPTGYLSYALARTFWGRGVMTEELTPDQHPPPDTTVLNDEGDAASHELCVKRENGLHRIGLGRRLPRAASRAVTENALVEEGRTRVVVKVRRIEEPSVFSAIGFLVPDAEHPGEKGLTARAKLFTSTSCAL